ncbi:Glycosyltransferase involved in cell wall bisynthesis [Butyrivibrio proteoclasticus]|uniref:Glycosyltransferase involved in cell wall bisynthesis n=1 Tax=Butyrivibrio proteoclasticus TaxID=43305 RepID=A0A1I5VQV1_9FIRM|nr:glycosyltransferase family 4 protein [Butyrivibrio proteoclasticus]SFQ09832.1 Glycosyltransferase involved in cell wall bisynthesis [Butyrivibrio proteoclasticus]
MKKSDRKPRVCMIVQQPDVMGGIAAVTNGYYGSEIEDRYELCYVQSYCDGSKFKKLFKALKAYAQFYKVLRMFKPEMIHIHSSFGPSFYRMQPFLYMAKRRNIPVVDHCHGADFNTFYVNASEKKKKRIREVYKDFAKIIVLSDEWKETMSVIVPKDKLVVIENYCKPQDEDFVKDLFSKRFEKKQVLFLGEIGKRKGGYDFAGIIEETIKENRDISFVLCGSGTESDVNEIKEAVYEVAPKEKVLFPGWVRGGEKDNYLKESAVFMLPSYDEGLPMSILDAMAYGLPIVSTNVGGIPQLVADGKSGYICTPGNVKEIANGIKKLLSEKERYIESSMESYRVARERYSFSAHLKKLFNVYDSVIK